MREDAVPQMAGAEDVVDKIERRDGVEYAGLVLNEKGFERFQATGLDRMNMTLGATESFNRRNANASLEEAKDRASRIVSERPKKTTVTISVAFGCPFEGRVDPAGRRRASSSTSEGSEPRRSSSRTRSASPHRSRCRPDRADEGGRIPRPQHSQHRLRERVRRARGRRDDARRLDRRPRRLSVRARARQGTSPPRTSSTCSRATESRPGVDLDALIAIASGSRRPRPAARGPALPSRALPG